MNENFSAAFSAQSEPNTKIQSVSSLNAEVEKSVPFNASVSSPSPISGDVNPTASFRASFSYGSGGAQKIPIMSETVAGIAKVGDNLKIDADGRLSVDTADEVSDDNTKPITAAAVHTTVGNIEILLATI